mmetsp:Transcript_16870/g.31949  ORF Transcript_16870/g.31949 Transcript_16870/m.31949 type:complete len:436 (+) Transcript_16870:239-1546(+)
MKVSTTRLAILLPIQSLQCAAFSLHSFHRTLSQVTVDQVCIQNHRKCFIRIPCRYSTNQEIDGPDPSEQNRWKTVQSRRNISNMLVVGDGDLSFSASISRELDESNIELVATVLEDKITHETIYQRSLINQEMISSFHHHQVLFGIDATNLQTHFLGRVFDRIQFNFPHWKGKANHRYNRQLIDAFLKSASEMISVDAEIHMTLIREQGGCNAKTLAEYRDSWTPLHYAAEHNLLLSKVTPFKVKYNLSSHRGVDRGFNIGCEPQTFVFFKAGSTEDMNVGSIPKEYQLCCRHEVHILLPDGLQEDDDSHILNMKWRDITREDAVRDIVQKVVPEGIRVEVPSRNILHKKDTGYESNMAVFLVVYCGESKAMKRDEADDYRHLAEMEIEKYLPLRENRKGRLVSKPFPYFLLDSILKDNASYGLMKAKDAASFSQ